LRGGSVGNGGLLLCWNNQSQKQPQRRRPCDGA
jgi:hypothetical protein